MIEVKNLTKKYESVKAVDQLSFQVETSETLALIGTSGSGKTTTLKMINRLIEPSSGEIILNGQLVNQLPVEEMRRKMGYVIQEAGLFPHYTVEENIGVVPKLLQWDKPSTKARVHQLMTKLGLPPEQFADKLPAQLSGGQQQRVGIARALAADPPIILMDEPFGALDPITRQKVRREFMELEELSSKTTIMVTHDVEEAFEMADWICLLHKGQMQQFGRPADLLFRPANAFVKQFLEGQQLQLEFKAIALKQLLPFLSTSSQIPSKDSVQIPSEEKLWPCLAQLASGINQGTSNWNGKAIFFNSAELMDAFYTFKSQN